MGEQFLLLMNVQLNEPGREVGEFASAAYNDDRTATLDQVEVVDKVNVGQHLNDNIHACTICRSFLDALHIAILSMVKNSVGSLLRHDLVAFLRAGRSWAGT